MKKKFVFVFGHDPNLLPPAIDMIDVLTMLGHSVKLIFLGNKHTEYNIPNSFIVPVSNYKPIKYFYGLALSRKVFDLFKKEKFNYLVGVDLIGLNALYHCRKLTAVKKIYWAFELHHTTAKISLRPDFFRIRLTKFFTKHINILLVPSEERLGYFHVSKNCKTEIILNARVLTENIKQQKTDLINIIYSGRISHTQRVSELVSSFTQLPHNYILHLAGTGEKLYLADLFESINKNNLNERIIFHGNLSKNSLSELLSKMDIGIAFYGKYKFGSKAAPTPNKIGDYISKGIFIIGSTQPYLQYWLDNRKLGITIDDFTPTEITGAILKATEYLNDQQKRTHIHKIFKEEYNMNIQAEKLLAVLDT